MKKVKLRKDKEAILPVLSSLSLIQLWSTDLPDLMQHWKIKDIF